MRGSRPPLTIQNLRGGFWARFSSPEELQTLSIQGRKEWSWTRFWGWFGSVFGWFWLGFSRVLLYKGSFKTLLKGFIRSPYRAPLGQCSDPVATLPHYSEKNVAFEPFVLAHTPTYRMGLRPIADISKEHMLGPKLVEHIGI